MEIVVLVIAILTIGDPEWLGRHLARAQVWSEYYRKEERQTLRRTVAKTRLKRIRKKYPNAFRSQK